MNELEIDLGVTIVPKSKVLAKILEAKKEIGKVAKSKVNPHFKNTYADINALIDAVETILLDKGLLMLQPIINGNVRTEIHDSESGEFVFSEMALPVLANPQQMGSAITYYRRYTLQSILSLQAEDDDGQKASAKPTIVTDRFEQALQAIQDGKYTKEQLLQNFTLTELQNRILTALD
jgi:hypothetical protein